MTVYLRRSHPVKDMIQSGLLTKCVRCTCDGCDDDEGQVIMENFLQLRDGGVVVWVNV